MTNVQRVERADLVIANADDSDRSEQIDAIHHELLAAGRSNDGVT